MAIMHSSDKGIGDMLEALGLSGVISFNFSCSVNSMPTISVTRYASVRDVEAITEFFCLVDKHPYQQLKGWAERKACNG